MPLKTQPEDIPAAVRFSAGDRDGAFEVTVSSLNSELQGPYRIEGGAPRFASRDAFKARVVEAGMSPAVAEDQTRSFNATARQLRELGFSVNLPNASS
ncbi:MAG TPA: hypothetical protein VHX37_07410 [Acidobacteriaceae bacterium]|jgi:hypothetical protein|nr:hypothetical protein [Acidobacteriaceae bacterium]